ncbi:uncharacterized protein LOC142337822 [Convolutriloba macropyga]|uniref:uncharacterized protein LOC142337822 n=1 Tax=Convolutriloba macropyga TaxID=536237 RepID=UPI003F525388
MNWSRFESSKVNTRAPGSCKKCGYAGHLAYQCFNTVQFQPLKKPTETTKLQKVGQHNQIILDVSSTSSDSNSAESDHFTPLQKLNQEESSKKKKKKKRHKKKDRKRAENKIERASSDSESETETKKRKRKRKKKSAERSSIKSKKRRKHSSSSSSSD